MNLEQRVRSLAAAGGDLTAIRTQLAHALRASVAYDFGAISTVDPSTLIWTSCFVTGLPHDPERQREKVLFDLEFRGDDLNSYTELANSGRDIGCLHEATDGDLTRAKRFGLLLADYDCTDEMRVILHSRDLCWGTLTLYRAGASAPFDRRDREVMQTAIGAIADLFRLTFLRAALVAPGGVDQPPGVLLVTRGGEIERTSDAATSWIDVIDDRGRVPSVIRAVAAASIAGNGLARAAVLGRDGRWIVLHGSPVTDSDDVAIIVEGARPVVLSEVIARVYGFTSRERDVTALAAQGRSTKQIASALGISPFTVQDHLKAVFAKTGVQSRSELVATLYLQQYEPRVDAGSTPSPYGWYLDDEMQDAV